MENAANPEQWWSFLGMLAEAFQGKSWGTLAFLVLTLMVFLVRKYVAKVVPVLASGTAAIVMTFLLATSSALVSKLDSGGVSVDDVVSALVMAFAASGGWATVKHLVAAGAAKGWKWMIWLQKFMAV